MSAEPDAVAALVGRAAGLPLALSVTCARAASRPGALLSDLAAELADARDRLDALQTGDATTDLRAVFSWSVDKLSAAAARAFRLLSLHPGPDISAPAAASLIAATLPQTRAALAELVRASLLTEDDAGRFGYHDLLRAYAAELSAATDSAADRDAALHRILDHYLRTAQAAAARLFPARSRLRLPPRAAGCHRRGVRDRAGQPRRGRSEYRVLRCGARLVPRRAARAPRCPRACRRARA